MDKLYTIGQLIKCYKIIDYDYTNPKLKYKCECIKCGNIVTINGATIKTSKGLGCKKCFNNSFINIDLIGKSFGCYTVIDLGEKTKKEQLYICQCKCGNKISLNKTKITKKEHICCKLCRPEYLKTNNGSFKHGSSKSQLYNIWSNMKARCNNPKNNRYYCYGAKGIKICDEWLGYNGYKNFMKWAYENGYVEYRDSNRKNIITIDRIDNTKNYEPSNCRWVNKYIQANNTSRNKFAEYNGEKHTWKEWSRILNIPYHRLQYRLGKGMNFENAIKDCNYNDKRHTLFGEKHTIKELSTIIGCSTSVIIRSIRNGIKLEDLYKKWVKKEV